MVRNKVQPYIVPSIELKDVVGIGSNTSVSVAKREYASQGRKYGTVRSPSSPRAIGM